MKYLILFIMFTLFGCDYHCGYKSDCRIAKEHIEIIEVDNLVNQQRIYRLENDMLMLMRKSDPCMDTILIIGLERIQRVKNDIDSNQVRIDNLNRKIKGV